MTAYDQSSPAAAAVDRSLATSNSEYGGWFGQSNPAPNANIPTFGRARTATMWRSGDVAGNAGNAGTGNGSGVQEIVQLLKQNNANKTSQIINYNTKPETINPYFSVTKASQPTSQFTRNSVMNGERSSTGNSYSGPSNFLLTPRNVTENRNMDNDVGMIAANHVAFSKIKEISNNEISSEALSRETSDRRVPLADQPLNSNDMHRNYTGSIAQPYGQLPVMPSDSDKYRLQKSATSLGLIRELNPVSLDSVNNKLGCIAEQAFVIDTNNNSSSKSQRNGLSRNIGQVPLRRNRLQNAATLLDRTTGQQLHAFNRTNFTTTTTTTTNNETSKLINNNNTSTESPSILLHQNTTPHSNPTTRPNAVSWQTNGIGDSYAIRSNGNQSSQYRGVNSEKIPASYVAGESASTMGISAGNINQRNMTLSSNFNEKPLMRPGDISIYASKPTPDDYKFICSDSRGPAQQSNSNSLASYNRETEKSIYSEKVSGVFQTPFSSVRETTNSPKRSILKKPKSYGETEDTGNYARRGPELLPFRNVHGGNSVGFPDVGQVPPALYFGGGLQRKRQDLNQKRVTFKV